MRVLRCSCGAKAVFFENDSYQCAGCEVCMTACGPKGEQKILKPHKWAVVFDDQSGSIYLHCTVCKAEDKLEI